MAEYISKNAIKDAINKKARAEFTLRDDYLQLIMDFQMALEVIESIPAADVRPVVRGKWRFEKGDGKTCVDGWVCSACNCGFHTNVPYFEGYNFCPNCGADMRIFSANCKNTATAGEAESGGI